jgi:putative Holliday junction resolvase
MSKPIAIGRRVGFDFGEKRIGVATSDSESILVSPHATLLNDEKLLIKLQEIITEVNPLYIVVGNPRHLSGESSTSSEAAAAFGSLLRSIFAGPIYLVDERLSTSNAYSQMREIGKSERESKAVIDQIAAINILESALLNERSGSAVGQLL